MSLKFVSAAKRVRNGRIKFVIFQTNSLFCHSYSSSVIWAFIITALYHISRTRFWVKLWRKMNANRRNWFCCLVLSYCDRRIWIAINENWWQSTKLNDHVSKLIDQRWDWNEHSHIPECPGRNWFFFFFLLHEELTKMGGKTYIIY